VYLRCILWSGEQGDQEGGQPSVPQFGTSLALHCTALHCTALHYTTLHYTALHCIPFRTGATDPRIMIEWLTPHNKANLLHCTALHCIDTIEQIQEKD
jgi:hypothetical protein